MLAICRTCEERVNIEPNELTDYGKRIAQTDDVFLCRNCAANRKSGMPQLYK